MLILDGQTVTARETMANFAWPEAFSPPERA